jgi:hypothetical protein
VRRDSHAARQPRGETAAQQNFRVATSDVSDLLKSEAKTFICN